MRGDLKEDSKLIGEIIVVSGMGWPSDLVLESVVREKDGWVSCLDLSPLEYKQCLICKTKRSQNANSSVRQVH